MARSDFMVQLRGQPSCPLGEQHKALVLNQQFRNLRREDHTIPDRGVKPNQKAKMKERPNEVIAQTAFK